MENDLTNTNWLDGKEGHEVLEDCLRAQEEGTLIEPKHDPDKLPRKEATFRTVISHETKNKLVEDLKERRYDVELLHDSKHNSQIAALYPRAGSTLTVAGSGILPYDSQPTTTQDALVVAYGKTGPHIFAEHKSKLKSDQIKGQPRYTPIKRPQHR